MRPLCLGLLLLAGAAQAQSYPYLGFRMLHTEADPFRFLVDARRTAPDGLSFAQVEAAAIQAARTWDEVACASTAFAYDGPTPEGTQPGSDDGVNVVAVWVTSVDDAAYDLVLGSGIATAASIPVHSDGVLEGCDVYLNAVDFRWSALEEKPDHVDLQTALLHELGHCQGLDHPDSPDAVMYASLPIGRAHRTLSAGDVEQLCAWSPSEGGQVAVGAPCTEASECGGTAAWCLPESGPAPAGEATWSGGYCTQRCGEGQPACPSGAHCARLEDGLSWCVQACQPGSAACRQGYACMPVDASASACLPRCRTDADCSPGHPCRTCDGVCLAPQAEGARLGDACSEDAQCGPGQVCGRFGAGGQGVCTQRCEGACAGCPTGTTCHAPGPGEARYCLRDCTDGTCPAGQQCAELGGGEACLPACHGDEDCAVGRLCLQGLCSLPPSDAGPSAPDAGVGSPQVPGCGCRSGPGPLASVLCLLLVLLRRSPSPPGRGRG